MMKQPPKPAPLSGEDQSRLLELARASIKHGLEQGCARPVRAADFSQILRAPGAAFVTLKKQGRLRGCIGSVEAYRSLAEDVAENAWHAAFSDPRFPPLDEDEFLNLQLEISILSHPEKMNVRSEAELKAQLVPGEDGLILEDGYRRGLFLPAVWDQLPSVDSFVAHLKQKAGMSLDHWSSTLVARRFYSFEFGEQDV